MIEQHHEYLRKYHLTSTKAILHSRNEIVTMPLKDMELTEREERKRIDAKLE